MVHGGQSVARRRVACGRVTPRPSCRRRTRCGGGRGRLLRGLISLQRTAARSGDLLDLRNGSDQARGTTPACSTARRSNSKYFAWSSLRRDRACSTRFGETSVSALLLSTLSALTPV